MVQTLTSVEVVDRLLSDKYARWSSDGAWALVDYLEKIENETGQPLEFDRVEIRSDYSEYGSACGAAAELIGGQWGDEAEAVAALEQRTTVIGVKGGGVIVQAF